MLCLLLLAVFCLAWAAIALFAFAHGNPFQLVHPSNSEGEICGRGEHAGSASKSSIRRFVITEKAPTRAFSWLKAATTAFTFKTLLRHYAKQA